MPSLSRTTPTTASASTGTPATSRSTSTDPQDTVGNAAVASGVSRGPSAGPSTGTTVASTPGTGSAVTPALPPANPGWSKNELINIQNHLARLGLYRIRVDGIFGKGTSAALVEAFGSDEWATLGAATVLERLKAAATPTGDAAKQRYRYGEMARDGLLDFTIGVGFDESGSHFACIDAFTEALEARKFTLDAAAATAMYATAGRSVANAEFGKYFVKKNAMTYKPPAGTPRTVNAVVRFVDNGDGKSGKQAAEAFAEGMTESDVTFYGGHGRYGSGPDFDRNMTFDLLDADGKVERHVDDYEDLQDILKEEGKKSGRGPWGQFQWRLTRHRILVNGSNEGNIFLNAANQHGGEFGAKMMYWNMLRSGSAGAPVQTGKQGDLAKRAEENPQHRYTLQVFNGCRTQDYVKSLRGTPGMDKRGADIIASTRSLYWKDMAATMAAFLDSVLNQQSAEATVKAMDDQQVTNRPAGNAGKGFGNF